MDLEALRARLEVDGQEHLLHFWTSLNDDAKQELIDDVESIDVTRMVLKFRDTMELVKGNLDVCLDEIMKPPPPKIISSSSDCSQETLEKYRKTALEAIAKGKLAVILLAGGQGTRLGVPYPKGMFSVGLPSKKTLYQIQAERIKRLQFLAEELTGVKANIPWYIMTSGHTLVATTEFLASHNHFGLDPSNILIFDQGLAPCFDLTGRILLATESKIAKSPDGNGGLYASLRKAGMLDDMASRGVDCVHVYGVDNLLVKVADPVFVGYCLEQGADCAAKVVAKEMADEPVGVFCDVSGKFQVVEYSEILPATAAKRNEDGTLTFSAGNICNHFFTLEFLQRVCSVENEDKLQYHPATKKIPCMDPQTHVAVPKPPAPNGIKLEKFVFDVFAFATNFRLWQVKREDEFSPVKNADGASKDTPTTAREMLYAFDKSLIEKAGGSFKDSEQNLVVEISPLTSYDGEGLETLVKGKVFDLPCIL
ncbi:unnamed protein product [Notodromas monacha]|uniref:UDP-N-acetylglucosamine diphosphorylase n=2 Tax=Notodromas monacha TaxID=399045 RepID=A0A7R9BRL7_9CRUS|nr:unnamed protein product [Notodromas monacha]CAG0919482.1 unnamed protein product [Notodromas monacha]